MSAPDAQSQLNRPRLIAFALALITLLVYLPVCFHDWIYFDDPAYVLDNPVVRQGITWAGLKWAFIGWHASNWHPLTWLSHMLDCQLFGLNPGAQHFVNVLFHTTNGALLFVLWHRMTRRLWPSALVAALFAWHPLHVESIAWISERKDVLSTFFGLLALIAYVDYAGGSKAHPPSLRFGATSSPRSKVKYTLALLLFALGLLAKPMLVTLPFVMLLLDFWPLGRTSGSQGETSFDVRCSSENRASRTRLTGLVLEKIPFFLLTFASCIVTFLAQHQQAVVSLKQYSLSLRLENVLVSYARYIFKTFFPVHLAAYYPLPDNIPPLEVAVALVVLAVVSALAWCRRRQNPAVLVGWLWFLGTLVPVIGFIQVGSQAMADRYSYLPSIGLFVAIVFGIAEAATRLKSAPILACVSALTLLACIALTEYQLQFWQNTQTLFSHALAVTKNNGPAHMMLGVWFERNGHPDDALPEYQSALHDDPSLMVQVTGGEKRSLAAQVQLLLGQSAERSNQPTAALAHYRQALQLEPDLVEAYNNLGNLLDGLGAPNEALTNYQAAERLRPEEPLVHENLGTELLKVDRFDDAMREYEEASLLAPDDPRPFYLKGKAWLRRGETANAIKQFETALQHDPNDYQSLTFLARVLASDENAQFRNGTKAVELAQKANDLTGGKQPFILASLAMAYAEAGRFEDARQTGRLALQLTPPNTESYSTLQTQLTLYESNRPYRERLTPGQRPSPDAAR